MLDFSRLRVLVYGDIMLDEYVYGSCERISPEAPVPIVKLEGEQEPKVMLGGAGNVAANIRSLGAKATIVTEPGSSYYKDVRHLLGDKAVIYQSEPERVTSSKMRIYANGQQVARIDTDPAGPITQQTHEALMSQVRKVIHGGEIDAVIISDYGKGVVNERTAMDIAALTDKPLFIATKDITHATGVRASVRRPAWIAMNERELFQNVRSATEPSLEHSARMLNAITGCHAFITLGARGVYVRESGSEDDGVIVPTTPREVFDVAGAGDSALAAFALAIVSGYTPMLAADIANLAGGVAVAHRGTHAVRLDELRGTDTTPTTVGFISGCFDVIHAGHIGILKRAKAQCDYLVVGLNSDRSVEAIKGAGRPINDLAKRREVLLNIIHVNNVVCFDQLDPSALIRDLKPDILFRGDDGTHVDDVIGADDVRSWGGKVVLLPKLEGVSTTEILRKGETQ